MGIWVGKQAAAGAQVTMKDIRGDKVLWMCGHHPEAGWMAEPLKPCPGELLRTTNTLASGGARRATPEEDNWQWQNETLRELLDGMDALVLGPLKESVPELQNLGRRTDAMLAVPS